MSNAQRRKLMSQGDFDSACFLYAIANASIALTGKRVTYAKWNDALNSISHHKAFRLAGTGTGADPWKDDFHALWPVAKNFVRSINSDLDLRLEEGVDRSNIWELITEKSVVVVSNPAHWFAAVDWDNGHFFIACSAVLNSALVNNKKISYTEARSPLFRRPYNDRKLESDLRVFRRACFVLSSR
jgi:hypothetical protein